MPVTQPTLETPFLTGTGGAGGGGGGGGDEALQIPSAVVLDLRFGRLRLPTLTDEIQEAVGDTLSADDSGVAVARRRPRMFTLTLPLHAGAGDPDGYNGGLRMRRQMRAMIENSTMRLQGIYLEFTIDPEIDGWMVAGSGQIKYVEGGITLGQFAFELDSALRVGTLRTHRPARRAELYDRRSIVVPRDYRATVYAEDWKAVPPLALTALPGGAGDPLGYGRQPVTAVAQAGLDGTGYLVAGLQHGNVVDFEQPETSQNQGDVIVYDRREVTGLPEEAYNRVPNPSIEYGLTPWAANLQYNQVGATLTRTTATKVPGGGAASLEVATLGTHTNEGAEVTLTGSFRAGVAYTAAVYLKGAVGGESVSIAIGAGTDKAIQNFALTEFWKRYWVTWVPSGERTGATLALQHPTASAVRWFVDAAQVSKSSAPESYFDGDSPGHFWVGGTKGGVSGVDPQDFGWEEVYGPDQPLTKGCVVLRNGLCRVRPTLEGGLFAIYLDRWDATAEAWALAGEVQLWDTTDQSGTKVRHNWPLTRPDGAQGTVLEWTPERAVVRVSTNRTSTEARVRADTYITLQRGWTAPRFETYLHVPIAPQSGCEIRWVPASASAMVRASGTGAYGVPRGPGLVAVGDEATWEVDATYGAEQFANAPADFVEPWVAHFPLGGGPPAVLTSLQSLAHSRNTVAGGHQATGVLAPYGVNQSRAGAPLYGYASLHMGFARQTPLQVFEAETYMVGGGTRANVADGLASAGHAIEDTQAIPTPPTITSASYSPTGGSFKSSDNIEYEITTLTAAGESLPSVPVDVAVPKGTTGSVALQWTAVTGAIGYRVYRRSLLKSPPAREFYEVGNVTAFTDLGEFAFYKTPTEENFEEAALGPLPSSGSGWQPVTGAVDKGRVEVGGWVPSPAPTESGARLVAQANGWTAVRANLRRAAQTPGEWIGVWLCLKPAARTGYLARCEALGGQSYRLTIERWSAGAKTVLLTRTLEPDTVETTFSPSEVGLALNGTVLQADINGRLFQATDGAPLAAEYPGIGGSGVGWTIESVELGHTAGYSATRRLYGYPPTTPASGSPSLSLSAAQLSGLPLGKYMIWVRVRAAGSVSTITVSGGFGGKGGSVTRTADGANLSSVFYTWLPVGESVRTDTTSTLTILGATISGTPGVYLDRVVMLPTELRNEAAPTYDGVRDLSAMHLYDSRGVPELVERS